MSLLNKVHHAPISPLLSLMGFGIFLLSLLLLFLSQSPLLSLGENVTVTVSGVAAIANTDDNFVCATLDWWPPTKCNYNQCPWGLASILNLDLDNPILPKAIKAFSPLRIRLGGSLQDQVKYNVKNSVRVCHGFMRRPLGLFGFSTGCLQMDRWDRINDLLSKSGAMVTFGLNALSGRKKVANNGTLWGGNWNPSNARDFIQYIISKGQNIDSFEFGNELSGTGIGAKVDAKQYGEDTIVLKQLLDELYKNSSMAPPKVLGPGGFFDKNWYSEFLETSGPGVVSGVTHHIYNLGGGDDPQLVHKIQDPNYLDQVAQTYKDVNDIVKAFAPWGGAWVGESGGAYNSGGKDVSHTFLNSFWYLDQLGLSAKFDHKVFCRQTLIGGNYGLLNTTTLIPNPDYYSALLWHRLMGKQVLDTTHTGSPYLRAYAHCSKTEETEGQSGITVLLMNLSNSTSFEVSIANHINLEAMREEYHLTPKDGKLQSDIMVLNGSPLDLTSTGDIPALNPSFVQPSSPVKIAPSSIVFVRVKGFSAQACTV